MLSKSEQLKRKKMRNNKKLSRRNNSFTSEEENFTSEEEETFYLIEFLVNKSFAVVREKDIFLNDNDTARYRYRGKNYKVSIIKKG